MSVGNHGLHFKVADFIGLDHFQKYSTAEISFLFYGEFLKNSGEKDINCQFITKIRD